MGNVTGGFLNGILVGADVAAGCECGHESDGSSGSEMTKRSSAMKCDHQKRLRGGAANKMTRRLTRVAVYLNNQEPYLTP
jgi:hypothetical protein